MRTQLATNFSLAVDKTATPRLWAMRRLGLTAFVLSLAILAGCATKGKEDDVTTAPADKLMQMAKTDIAAGNYDVALKTLKAIESRFPFGVYSQQAILDGAYVQYKKQEMAEALIAIDRFMRLYPNNPATDYAIYLKGLINFNENQGLFARFGGQDLSERDLKAARDSFDIFKELVTRFPNSQYASDSRLRMNYLINNIAAGEVHVARYYFRRGAYVAAINRSAEVVRGYSDAPAIEEALYILWRSYRELGVNDLAADSERVLRKNFPQSEFFATGVQTNTRRWWQVWR